MWLTEKFPPVGVTEVPLEREDEGRREESESCDTCREGVGSSAPDSVCVSGVVERVGEGVDGGDGDEEGRSVERDEGEDEVEDECAIASEEVRGVEGGGSAWEEEERSDVVRDSVEEEEEGEGRYSLETDIVGNSFVVDRDSW